MDHAQISHSNQARVRANGIELVYDTFGDPADPPMLLVMGLGAQMTSWDEVFCQQLAARGYWVIRFDNRDIGLSTSLDEAGVPDLGALTQDLARGKPVQVPYLLKDMAADAVGLLDALGIEQAHIVGASMGGMIVQEIAINFPDWVRTLTSIMSTTGNPELPRATPEVMAALLQPAPTERAAYIEHAVRTWSVFDGPAYPRDPERTRKIAARDFDRGLNPAGGTRQMAAIMASRNRKPLLAGVTVPTLVIHGSDDPLVPVQGGIDTAESIPGAKLTIIEGMGHDLHPDTWTPIIDAIAAHAA